MSKKKKALIHIDTKKMGSEGYSGKYSRYALLENSAASIYVGTLCLHLRCVDDRLEVDIKKTDRTQTYLHAYVDLPATSENNEDREEGMAIGDLAQYNAYCEDCTTYGLTPIFLPRWRELQNVPDYLLNTPERYYAYLGACTKYGIVPYAWPTWANMHPDEQPDPQTQFVLAQKEEEEERSSPL